MIDRRSVLSGAVAIMAASPAVAVAAQSAADPITPLLVQLVATNAQAERIRARKDAVYAGVKARLCPDYLLGPLYRWRNENRTWTEEQVQLRTDYDIDKYIRRSTIPTQNSPPEILAEVAENQRLADEMTKELAARKDAWRVALESEGYDALEEHLGALLSEAWDIEGQICRTVATTPAGIFAQIQIAESWKERGDPGDDRHREAFANLRAAVAAMVSDPSTLPDLSTVL